ncbi:replication restart helicase PriA [Acholeplasma granularum]|uniref:replication restart helicase PriA n=1 Tax=Acholeplasma granularum TaxID=264635 RepID=UPI000471F8AB|nr:primosomal protein N' [Acholeplasma granularum]
MIASVIIDIKHQNINRQFDYFVLDEDKHRIKKGMRVLVPFGEGNHLRLGFVYEIKNDSVTATKHVAEILDIEPIFNEELFLLMEHLSFNPNTIIAQAFETLLPKTLLMFYEKEVTLHKKDEIDESLKPFFKNGKWILKKKDEKYYSKLKTYEKNQIVKIATILKPRNKKRYLNYVRINNPNYEGTLKQQDALLLLKDHGQMLKSELVLQTSSHIVNYLIKKDVIESFEVEDKLVNKYDYLHLNFQNLNEDLKDYLNEISNTNHDHTFVIDQKNSDVDLLLFHVILEKIKNNQQVLIMVPETFMIPRYKKMFEQKFINEMVISLESSQTDKSLYMAYEAILSGESKIVIGARKSIFTQFNNLGLILIYDSNDSSYQSFEGIYYDAVLLSQIRSKFLNIPRILVDSSKSLMNQKLTLENKVTYLELDNHNNDKIIEIIDMKEELKKGNTKLISLKLKETLDDYLNKGKKVLLILNQKGYAPFVMCRTCSYVPLDPETNIPLRYDEKQGILKSNQTKYEEFFTKVCPKCGSHTVKSVGSGIDQLITYLHKVYPKKEILKVDKDSITNKKLYESFDDLEDIQLIVGTKMALKSILKDKVSLVAILMIDQWLKLPIYNAHEETYEILNQAKSITKESLFIQSYDPSHYVLQSVKENNDMYYKKELSIRKQAKLPPYYKILQLKIEGSSYLKTYQFAQNLKIELENHGLITLGPTPSVVLVENNQYRLLLLIKYQKISNEVRNLLQNTKDIKIYMNPSMMWY